MFSFTKVTCSSLTSEWPIGTFEFVCFLMSFLLFSYATNGCQTVWIFNCFYLKFSHDSFFLFCFRLHFPAVNEERLYKVLEAIEHFNLLQLGAIHLERKVQLQFTKKKTNHSQLNFLVYWKMCAVNRKCFLHKSFDPSLIFLPPPPPFKSSFNHVGYLTHHQQYTIPTTRSKTISVSFKF